MERAIMSQRIESDYVCFRAIEKYGRSTVGFLLDAVINSGAVLYSTLLCKTRVILLFVAW